MEKLADLPPAALITFGVTLAIIFAVQRLGLWQGQRAAPSTDSAQVAAVIVDPSALNKATAALEAQTEEAVNQRKSIERAVDNLVECLRDVTRSISALREELIRNSKGR